MRIVRRPACRGGIRGIRARRADRGNRHGDRIFAPRRRGIGVAALTCLIFAQLVATGSVVQAQTLGPVTNLTLSATSEVGGSLTASWDNPSGGFQADLQIRTRANSNSSWSSWTEYGSRHEGEIANIAGLLASRQYQVRVKAFGAGTSMSDWTSSSVASPTITVPARVFFPDVSTGHQSLIVSWSPPPARGAVIDDYDVRHTYDSDNDNDYSDETWVELPDITKSTALSIVITGLSNDREYKVQVRAGNSAGDGQWSESADGAPDAVPSAPSAPTVTSANAGLSVLWTAPSDNGYAIDDYDLRYRHDTDSDGSFDDEEWAYDSDGSKSTSLSTSISNLINATEYQVQVRAGNERGDGPWSASSTGTPATVPSAPSAPTVTRGNASLSVSWSAPANNGSAIDDYDVRYRHDSDNDDSFDDESWSFTADVNKSTSLSTSISGLTNGTEYQVQVRAGNGRGDGLWSASSTGTPATVPSAPSAPTVTRGNASLSVSWSAPANNGSAIDDYDVRYRYDSDNDDSFDDESWSYLADVTSSTSLSASISGLTNGTEYQVQVRAGNGRGDGTWSVSSTGTPATVPSKPSAPTVTPGNRSLLVAWTAPADNGAVINDYDVRYRHDSDNDNSFDDESWTSLADATNNSSLSASISGLTNGTEYQVQIRAGNGRGDGAWSDSSTGTPQELPVVTLSLSSSSISETGGSTTVSATLSRGISAVATITVSAIAASPTTAADFALSANRTLTIASGQTTSTGTVTVSANGNSVDAADKTLTVRGSAASSVSLSGPADALLTITDDDTASLSASTSSVSVPEGRRRDLHGSVGKRAYSISERRRCPDEQQRRGSVSAAGRHRVQQIQLEHAADRDRVRGSR